MIKKKLAVLWIGCILLFSVATVFCEETVTVGVNEYAPLLSENMKHNGVMGRILTEIFALEGMKVELKWIPWKRAYLGVKEGKRYDLTPCWSKNAEREKDVYFSDPLYEMYHVFFHLKTFPIKWQSYDDLKEYKIGATIGYFYGDDFKNAESSGKIKVEYAPSDYLNFKKLVKGRFQVFPINFITGPYLARKSLTPEEFSSITSNPKPVSTHSNHYVLFSKNEKGLRLLQLFNKGLKQLKGSGKFDKYFEESRHGEYDSK